jgi:hypothetical protein
MHKSMDTSHVRLSIKPLAWLRAIMYMKSNLSFMFKIQLTVFILLLLIIPASAIDTDKWDLVTRQEIVPQQSFPAGDYTITLAEQEKNGFDDYTVIVYLNKMETDKLSLCEQVTLLFSMMTIIS